MKPICFLGDVMLGRLVDASRLPYPILQEYEHGKDMTALGRQYKKSLNLENKSKEELYKTLWGNTISVIGKASVTILNLECCITTSEDKWPGKAFNYRTNPANIEALSYFPTVFSCCANNHILDYGYNGQKETEEVLNSVSIYHAGTGRNEEEAKSPVVFTSTGSITVSDSSSLGSCSIMPKIMVYSFSDHGSCQKGVDGKDTWASSTDRPGLNFVDVRSMNVLEMENIAHGLKRQKILNNAEVSIVSCHWGPNWSWEVSSKQRELAQVLMKKGEVDIIHGHSSHHIQGIEFIEGKPVMYGCGAFIDDYAVNEHYRNDLGFIYMCNYPKSLEESTFSSMVGQQRRVQSTTMTLYPIKIELMTVRRITAASDPDFKWLHSHMTTLCRALGSQVDLLELDDSPVLEVRPI